MTFDLASNNLTHLLSSMASCVGCLGSDLIFDSYCRDSFASLAPKLVMCVPTHKLSTRLVLNAPIQSLRPWLCT